MHPSFQTLLFPSQQLPLMAVIYMASRQHNVYKIILGKKDLNNSCQASKGAAVGSALCFFFPLFSSACVLPTRSATQQHSTALSTHRVAPCILPLQGQTQPNSSSAAPALQRVPTQQEMMEQQACVPRSPTPPLSQPQASASISHTSLISTQRQVLSHPNLLRIALNIC